MFERERQVVLKDVEGIDDRRRGEFGHIGHRGVVLGAANGGQAWREQTLGYRHRQVGRVVVGHRRHGSAARLAQAGGKQHVRVACIRRQGDGWVDEFHHFRALDLLRVEIERHRRDAFTIQGQCKLRPRFAETGDQDERMV